MYKVRPNTHEVLKHLNKAAKETARIQGGGLNESSFLQFCFLTKQQ